MTDHTDGIARILQDFPRRAVVTGDVVYRVILDVLL